MSLDLIIETGSYTGNGTTQSISIGWLPALVSIFDTGGGGPSTRAASFKVPDMADDDWMRCSSVAAFATANGITLTSDGFDLGSDNAINDTDDTFHFIAVRAGPWVDTGTYTGDGGTTTVTTGRQPSAVLISQVDGTVRQFWKFASQSSALATEFQTAVAEVSAVTLTSTGFEATGNANTNTQNFDWIAFYDLVGSTRHFEMGSFTGDGGTTQTITLGKLPKFLFVWNSTSGSLRMGFKTSGMGGDDYGALTAAYSFVTTLGITILAPGFTVGSSFNGIGATCFFLAGYE